MNSFDPNLICPLCAKHQAQHDGKKYVAREHIPPSCIFIEGTSDLITVPSCKGCNNETSPLDLQFKIFMGLYLGRSAPSFWRDTLNSLNKTPQRKKMKQSIVERISPTLTKDDFGRFRHKLSMKKKYIDPVVTKIAKGLHWHVSGHCLPLDSKVTIKYLRQGESVKPEIQLLLNQHGHLIETGAGTFKAHYAITEDNNHSSIWKLIFYTADCFIVIITSSDKAS
jgi:hypothetical protein